MNADLSRTQDAVSLGADQADEAPARPLNRPARWLVAAAEVLVAVALAAFAVWAWRHASIPVRLPEYDNPAVPDFTSRTSGPWVAVAVGSVTVAGGLLLDALRQALLAGPAGHRTGAGGQPGASDPDGE